MADAVSTALQEQRQHQQQPSNHLQRARSRHRPVGNLERVGNVVVTAYASAPVRIHDVGGCALAELRRGAVLQGRARWSWASASCSWARTAVVTTALKSRLETVRRALLRCGAETVYDRTELVDHVIETVEHNLVARAIWSSPSLSAPWQRPRRLLVASPFRVDALRRAGDVADGCRSLSRGRGLAFGDGGGVTEGHSTAPAAVQRRDPASR
jgi:hypothetical protein